MKKSVDSAALLEVLTHVFMIIVTLDDVPFIVYDDSGGELTLWDRNGRLGNMYVENVTEYSRCGLTKAQFKRWLKVSGASENDCGL